MADSQRTSEDAGPEAEVRFRARLAQALGEAVIAAGPAGEITFWNAAAERLLGFPAAEALGRNLSQLSPDAAALLARGQSWAGELPLVRQDGTALRAQVTATFLRGAGGELEAMVCVCRDASESHAAAEAIRENALLQAQLDASLEGMVVVVGEKVVAINRRLLEVWGGNADGLLHQGAEALWAHVSGLFDDPGAVRAQFAAMRAGEVSGAEVKLKGGRVLRMRNAPIQGPQGPIGHVTFVRDVTLERTAQRSLEARARRQEAVAALGQRALLEIELQALLGEAMAVIARTLEMEYASFAAPAEGGRPGLRASFGWPLDRCALAVAEGARCLEGAQEGCSCGAQAGLSVPVAVRGASHGEIAVYSRAKRPFTADDLHFVEAVGNVLGAAIERRRADEALQSSERRFRVLLERARVGLLVARDRKVLLANGTFAALVGADPETIAGHPLSELLAKAPPAALLPFEEVEGRGMEKARGEFVIPGPAGEVAVEVEAFAFDSDGERTVLAITRDITERRRLQAHFMLADRLASVGTLAAGVAHELNNPLAYVTANLGYLADELGHADAALKLPVAELLLALREAREGTERMRGIISELRGFSRIDEDRRAEVDVRRAVESAAALAWNALRHRARLVKDLGEVRPVLADEGRLGQVFLNLLVNAQQSIPEGDPERNVIRIRTFTAPRGMVAVEVADTGCGIRPEDLGRIFDPFFTTKPVGVGTGLGLSVCHGIVTGLGGAIEVQSRVGEGSTFRVLLPAAPAAPGAAPPGPRASVPRGRVLVIDDEPLILAVFRRVLGAAHEVDTAASAAEAMERLSCERYDIVFCDLLMPEKSGIELYRELSRDAPEVASRMIFMTGGAFSQGTRQFLDAVPNLRMEKPFDAAALRALVASRLSPDRPR